MLRCVFIFISCCEEMLDGRREEVKEKDEESEREVGCVVEQCYHPWVSLMDLRMYIWIYDAWICICMCGGRYI